MITFSMLTNFQHFKSTAHKDMQDLTDPQTHRPIDRHTNELPYAYGASCTKA